MRVVFLVSVLLASLALGCASRSSTLRPTPTPVPEVSHAPLPPGGARSDLGTVSVATISPIAAGREASATIRYGAFQTCHAQIQYANGRGYPLGTYLTIAGGEPTWRWTPEDGAPTSGTFIVSCGLDTYPVSFTASGVNAQPVKAISAAVYPWPTPLPCVTGAGSCLQDVPNR